MRTKKMRLVSALLALAMLFVMMPVGAFATDMPQTSGNCGAKGGNNITWKLTQNGDTVYEDNDGMTLTLEGSGAMEDYGSSGAPWSWASNTITQVEIPEGVIHIGDCSFEGFIYAKNIKIPTSVKSIGSGAFGDWCRLENVTLPQNLTSIGEAAFASCSSLKEIQIPEGVTAIERYTFNECKDLEIVTLPQNLTSIGEYAFYDCFSSDSESKLASIDIPSSVTNIGKNAFSGCKHLGSVTNMNGVTNIGEDAFSNCSKLTSIDIPNGVTSIEDSTFSGCMSLNSITIPSSVTTIGDDAFAVCVALKEITIPQQVGTIGKRTFTACAQLEKIDIESDSNLTTVGDHAFETTNYYLDGQNYEKLSNMMDALGRYGVTELAETKIYCGAPLKKSGLLSDKGVAEENIIASVTVKLVDGEKTETRNVPYGETVGTLEQPTKEGYTFVGWYDGNGEVFDPAAPLTEDTTIHAEWKKNAAPAPTPTPAPAPAPVDDDSVDAGAVAATVVLGAGTAALAYHIGTELYAEQVLGKGVVVPTLRGDVARKAWELAGKPAVTVAGNEAPDEDAQAQQWVVDQGLMKDRKDGKFHPEQWMSKLKALRTLDAAKKLG